MVTLKQAQQVSKYLMEAFDPLCIILFGSVAAEGVGNDLDLLMVTEDTDIPPMHLEREVRRKLRPFYSEFAIDPLVLPVTLVKQHFRTGSPFLRLIQRQGRSLYMKDSVKQWLDDAAQDLSAARYLLSGKFYRAACYHSQQALAKALKGKLIQVGWELERIHNIERLLALAQQLNVEASITDDEAVFMDSIYRSRYPAEEGLLPTGEPTKEDATRAIEIASKVCVEGALRKGGADDGSSNNGNAGGASPEETSQTLTQVD